MDKIIYDKSRVKNFNDAVFAIAMTLLILEITIPSAGSINEYGTLRVLNSLTPSFIGLLVSFLVTATFWVANLRIMGYAVEITHKVLWLNIGLLLFIVLLPFSTAFYVQGVAHVGPLVFYSINISVIGLFNFLMASDIMRTARQKGDISIYEANWQKARAMNPFIIWALAGAIAFISVPVARFVFILIFIIQPFIDRYYRKKERLLQEGLFNTPASPDLDS